MNTDRPEQNEEADRRFEKHWDRFLSEAVEPWKREEFKELARLVFRVAFAEGKWRGVAEMIESELQME